MLFVQLYRLVGRECAFCGSTENIDGYIGNGVLGKAYCTECASMVKEELLRHRIKPSIMYCNLTGNI